MSIDTHTYSVPGISCDHCRRAIEDQVSPLAGVTTVAVDIEAKTVAVSGGDPSAIEAAIGAAGYDIG